jgi:hypothetical protein
MHEKSWDARAPRIALLTALGVISASLSIPILSGNAGASGPDPQGTIYVTDLDTNSVDVFAPGSVGNIAPERAIQGAATGIDEPGDVKVSPAGDVYVANYGGNTITEYAPGASGNAAPICTIGGSNTELNAPDDFSLEPDGTLVIGNYNAGPTDIGVVVFGPGQCGNVAPEEAIGGSNTGLNTVDGVGTDAAGTIYADSTSDDSIQVFAAGSNGNVAPSYSIAGGNTGLGEPVDIVVGFNGKLYVNSGFGSPKNVEVFAPGSMGNVAPTQDIVGSNTTLGDPDDLAVDASGTIYLTDLSASPGGPSLLEFAPTATGNVAPSAVISGSNTTFVYPEGAAVAGPPPGSSATVTTTAAAVPSLGQGASDTATVAGGTTPTGSIVFKLFGPNDPTCSAAPTFVSSPQTVSGDGQYQSGSFTPAAVGTYSWEALYSGDTNNASVTTSCGDPAETFTVAVAGAAPPPGHGAIGYRLQGHDGGVFDFGNSLYYGSLPQVQTHGLVGSPIEATANTYDNGGYWLVNALGSVFPYGDAPTLGSISNHLNAPIVGVAGTPSMHGYWLVGADGGVFTFGDAQYYGGLGGTKLVAPIVGIAATPDGGGYWLVGADGGVFAFGNARYLGGLGGKKVSAPIVGIATTPNGSGYWLVGADGGVFAFGTTLYLGGLAGQKLNAPVVAIVAVPDGTGYWLMAADGGVFAFGKAPFLGSAASLRLNQPITSAST